MAADDGIVRRKGAHAPKSWLFVTKQGDQIAVHARFAATRYSPDGYAWRIQMLDHVDRQGVGEDYWYPYLPNYIPEIYEPIDVFDEAIRKVMHHPEYGDIVAAYELPPDLAEDIGADEYAVCGRPARQDELSALEAVPVARMGRDSAKAADRTEPTISLAR